MGEPAPVTARNRPSSIRRIMIGYLAIVVVLCGGFALLAIGFVATADRERAAALIEGDLTETLDKLEGPLELKRDKALAIVLARTAIGGERIYRLTVNGRYVAGVEPSVAFEPGYQNLLEGGSPPAIARDVLIAPGVKLLVGRKLVQGALTHQLLVVGICVLILALVIATASGLWAARSLTRRIDAINDACDAVRLGDFKARAPTVGRADEFGQLAAHVNAMLERIDVLVMGLRDVTNRIAHDLRTPVARLRHDIAEAAEARDLQSARELAGAAAAETDEILQTFEALLDIAEVEAGSPGGLGPMQLDDAVRSACDLYTPVAEAASVTLDCRLDPVTILGERTLIVRMAANLIDNAIKFSPAGAKVRIFVAQGEGAAFMSIADRGPGIRADERDEVFGRLVRGSAAVGVPGHGLGLALVSAVAKRHGATITLGDRDPGLDVTIRFAPFAPFGLPLIAPTARF